MAKEKNDHKESLTGQASIQNREWWTVNETLKQGWFGRTTLYKLLNNGSIKSRLIRSNRYAITGKRLIHAPSVLAFIERSEGMDPDEADFDNTTLHEQGAR